MVRNGNKSRIGYGTASSLYQSARPLSGRIQGKTVHTSLEVDTGIRYFGCCSNVTSSFASHLSAFLYRRFPSWFILIRCFDVRLLCFIKSTQCLAQYCIMDLFVERDVKRRASAEDKKVTKQPFAWLLFAVPA